jgi:hypothetical protein
MRAFPLTANGKVDRKALPPPPRQNPPWTEVLETHLDGLELLLLGCCRSVLDVPNFGLDDDFLKLAATRCWQAGFLPKSPRN